MISADRHLKSTDFLIIEANHVPTFVNTPIISWFLVPKWPPQSPELIPIEKPWGFIGSGDSYHGCDTNHVSMDENL